MWFRSRTLTAWAFASRPFTTRTIATRLEPRLVWTRRTLRRRTPDGRALLRRHHLAHLLRGVRQQGHVPRALKRGRKHPLVLRACAGLATRLDLRAIRQVPAQARRVLVVDELDLVRAERAHAPARTPLQRPTIAAAVAIPATARLTTAITAQPSRPRTLTHRRARWRTGWRRLRHLVSSFGLERDLVGV